MKQVCIVVFCLAVLLHSFDLSRLKAVDTLPIIPYGFGFSKATWNDPSLIVEGDSMVMYASASRGFAAIRVCIYRLVSKDGVSWRLSPDTAVLSPSQDSTAWDYGGIETPSVVYFNNKYHMYFTTYKSLESVLLYRTGHASSSDGIHWTKTANPVISPTGKPTDFNAYFTAEPGAVVCKNEVLLYFTTMGFDTTVMSNQQTIGLARSSDGVNFSSPVQVIKPNQIQYPRKDGWLGFSAPSAIIIDDTMHVFATVVNDSAKWLQYAIHHFTSSDGQTNFASDSAQLLRRTDFRWTQDNIAAPVPVMFKNKFMLYFAGSDFKEPDWNTDYWGIGLTVCDMPSTKIEKNEQSNNIPLFTLLGNPFTDRLVVDVHQNSLPVRFSLYDIFGRHCIAPTFSKTALFQVPSTSLAEGLYFLKAEKGSHTTVRTVIKGR
ncbi:MAG: T9SS type A sorting domain-containing protein [Fibrobacteres bacterium]|nr:T9SS type A sorting domain-containing protein [Fibrobacterota bacterium]